MAGGKSFWLPIPTSGGGGGSAELLDYAAYRPATFTTVTTTSTTLVDVDATNLSVTFTAPDSGVVRVVMSALCDSGGVVSLWGLRSGGAAVANSQGRMSQVSGAVARRTYIVYMTGLAGVYTWTWAHRSSSGVNSRIHMGGTDDGGQAVMEVWAA